MIAIFQGSTGWLGLACAVLVTVAAVTGLAALVLAVRTRRANRTPPGRYADPPTLPRIPVGTRLPTDADQ